MNAYTWFSSGPGRTEARLAAFIAVSIALHLLTAAGAGKFNLFARPAGDAPARIALNASLTPAKPTPDAASASAPGDADRKTADSAAPSGATRSVPDGAAAADEPGAPLPAADKWYTAREVDVRAEPTTDIPLRYPEHLLNEPVVGNVQVRLFIDERGVVRRLQIAASSHPGGAFDAAAKKAWEDVRFSPALKNGVPVKSQKVLELTFKPGLM